MRSVFNGALQVLERTPECGKKILVSGGTRCNVLPTRVDLERDFFTSTGAGTGALRQAFGTWTLEGARQWLSEDVGLSLAEEDVSSKVFPASNSAKEVRPARFASRWSPAC